MRTRVAVTSAAVVAFAALGVLSASTAIAAAPDRQGWWTATNLGAVSVPSADVPGDGLLVQGGPVSPLALAALAYSVPSGSKASTLELKVATGSTATPTAILKLCPLSSPSFSAAQGGPMADAPAYSCDKVSAVASANSDGVTFEFDASVLVSNGSLAVAVVPGGASDRVVLARPTPESLTLVATTSGESAQPAPSELPTTGTAVPPSTGGSDLPAGFGSAAAPPTTGQALGPTVAEPSTAPQVAESTPDAAPVTNVAAVRSAGNGRSTRLVLLLLGLLVAAAMWLSQGSAAALDESDPPGASPA